MLRLVHPVPVPPPSYGQLILSSIREGDVHSICLFGELDLASADSVQDELELVEATDARSIVLDLSGLQYLDSTGIRLLLSAHARSGADGDRLSLIRGSAEVQRVFELCGVAHVLPFTQ
jgi:anti-sigma B factor antagonist